MSLVLPSLLAFERKLEPSDGLMFSGFLGEDEQPDGFTEWQPIAVIPRRNLSTQSAYGTSLEDMKKPNPVAAENDDANLPIEHDTLKLTFSLRVIGGVGKPFASKDPAFSKAIQEKVSAFKASEQMKDLAYRYAYNIANGRFLWRNRVCADKVFIHVKINQNPMMIFDAYEFDLQNFEDGKENTNLALLTEAIYKGLTTEGNFVLISVEAYVKLGLGQHVFPSQEMNAGEKKKVLFKINNQAAMHNVKIGNALRTVDNWYPKAEFPIAVEPFGSVVQINEAFRPSKIDLYTLIQDWVNDKNVSPENQAYIVANLIRGGVFSGESKDKKAAKTNQESSEEV
jgi:CRISPR-associated protein Csy3